MSSETSRVGKIHVPRFSFPTIQARIPRARPSREKAVAAASGYNPLSMAQKLPFEYSTHRTMQGAAQILANRSYSALVRRPVAVIRIRAHTSASASRSNFSPKGAVNSRTSATP